MKTINPASGSDIGLSKRPPRLSIAERAYMADRLRLALDEIETGVGDYISLRNAVSFQRDALRCAHRRLDVLKGGAA